MGAEDDGILLGQLADEGTQLQNLLGVQAHGGLIQNEHLGEAQQRLGQAYTLAVALGQVANEAAQHLVHPGHLGHPVHLGLPLTLRHLFQLGGEA